jgi:hypothetical protein
MVTWAIAYKFVNGNTILTADPKQPSLANDQIYSSKVETARTDDDFQGFKADDNFKVRSEETPNHEPFVTTPYASNVCLSWIYAYGTDDSILTGPDPQELDDIVQEMKAVGLNLTVEGDISDFLGVQINSIIGNTFNLSQPHLINDVIKELRLDGQNVVINRTTGASSKSLCRHPDSPPFDKHFNYRRVVGQLNYLEKCSRRDISCAVHQAARFVSNPRIQHGKALKWLGIYLVGSRDKEMIYSPSNQSFDFYVDASFTGDWNPQNADWDPDTARSSTGNVILYASCPVVWASKLQTEIALSTTEAEYLAISTATRKVLPLMS